MTDSTKDAAKATSDAGKRDPAETDHSKDADPVASRTAARDTVKRAGDEEHSVGKNVSTASTEQRANEPKQAGNTDTVPADRSKEEKANQTVHDENVPERTDDRRGFSGLNVDQENFDIPALEVLVDRMQGSGDSFFFGKDVRSREGAQSAILELLEWAERVNVNITANPRKKTSSATTETANKS